MAAVSGSHPGGGVAGFVHDDQKVSDRATDAVGLVVRLVEKVTDQATVYRREALLIAGRGAQIQRVRRRPIFAAVEEPAEGDVGRARCVLDAGSCHDATSPCAVA